MQLKDLSDKTIFKLSDLATLLCDVDIHTPKQLAKDKADIEAVLPPDQGFVTEPFAMLVSIAFDYARTHYKDENHSLLSDIQKREKVEDIDISSYKFKLEER